MQKRLKSRRQKIRETTARDHNVILISMKNMLRYYHVVLLILFALCRICSVKAFGTAITQLTSFCENRLSPKIIFRSRAGMFFEIVENIVLCHEFE